MGENAEFSSPVLSIERAATVATLWLDRPEARNAMGEQLWRDLPTAMDVLGQDPEVRVVVVAAKGPHFSVGLDLKELGGILGGRADTGVEKTSGAARARSARAD